MYKHVHIMFKKNYIFENVHACDVCCFSATVFKYDYVKLVVLLVTVS